MTSWKTPGTDGGCNEADALLQWGHDFDVVEDWFPCHAIGREDRLQWGHDFDVVEDKESPAMAYLSEGFNGATTLTSWKTTAWGRRG